MKKTLAGLFFGSCLTVMAPAFSADVDFSGGFSQDNVVQRFDFSVNSPGNISIFTSSWLGGGFDPILTLWDSSGNQLFEQDDGGLGGTQASNGVVYQYGEFDSFLNVNLFAGNYIATLTQYDNFSASTALADGFLRDGDPLFTAAFGCSNGRFCEGSLVDSNNNPVEPNRTAAWDIHFVNVASAQIATVAEPSTLLLLAIAGFNLLRIRRETTGDMLEG